ncbi:MAG: hypothetical protein DRO67_00900 [Candidatus Asgardarchaeum californiense]|nr:MAG: hypothetical protein DRO67_00900 [Candidatus Asgardarchaeum californiense]
MERTLFILKPDAVMRRYVGAKVFERILNENISILSFNEIMISRDFAEIHYAEHKGKFFYNWLLDYITLSPVVVSILEDDNVVERIRQMLGKTLAHLADPNSIRGKYGIWGGVNVAHASDSIKTAERECELWINEFNIELNKENGEQLAKEYIKRWNKNVIDYSLEIRQVCRDFSNNAITESKAKALINELLYKNVDNEFSDKASKLTDIIIENVKFDKKK